MKKIVRRKVTDAQALRMVRSLKELSGHIKHANDEKGKLRKRLAPWVRSQPADEDGKIHVTLKDGRIRHQVAWVTPQSEVLDQEKLRSIVGDEVFDMCFTRTFSEQRLEELVAAGVIDPEKVQKCIKVVPGTPYPKIS